MLSNWQTLTRSTHAFTSHGSRPSMKAATSGSHFLSADLMATPTMVRSMDVHKFGSPPSRKTQRQVRTLVRYLIGCLDKRPAATTSPLNGHREHVGRPLKHAHPTRNAAADSVYLMATEDSPVRRHHLKHVGAVVNHVSRHPIVVKTADLNAEITPAQKSSS